jgi:hypothetical protein
MVLWQCSISSVVVGWGHFEGLQKSISMHTCGRVGAVGTLLHMRHTALPLPLVSPSVHKVSLAQCEFIMVMCCQLPSFSA